MHTTKKELIQLIKEELEVVLSNSEAIEMFGDHIAPQLAEGDEEVSAEISKLVKKGKSKEQAAAIALSMDEEDKLPKLEEHEDHLSLDLGAPEVVSQLQQIIDGIAQTNQKLSGIDTSIDYAAAALLGDDPENLEITQAIGGRVAEASGKWILRWSGHGQKFFKGDGEYGSRSDAKKFASEGAAKDKAKNVKEHGDGYHLIPEEH
jgi:hypothetical protein